MFHWPTFLFISVYHLLLFILVPVTLMADHIPTAGLLGFSFAMMFISGLGVTAGYHRLMSHTAYKTNRYVEAVLLFFASVATQGSALRWCYDHRRHHAYVDSDQDPYCIKKGFWYAHILWMFRRSPSIEPKVVSDLMRSPVIRFQHDHYAACFLVSNLAVYLFAGWFFNDWLGAFVWATLARMFTLHHLTWFINSLAHTWGTQSYSREHSAVDSYVLCLLTFGEGYHNYHHTFPQDFRNGIKWYHFDPTKWLIWTLSKLGLAWGLKKVDDVRIAKQLLQDHRLVLLEKLSKSFHNQKDMLEQKIVEVQEAVVGHISHLHRLVEQSRKSAKEDALKIAEEVRSTKKALKEDWRRWKEVVRSIEKERPSAAV